MIFDFLPPLLSFRVSLACYYSWLFGNLARVWFSESTCLHHLILRPGKNQQSRGEQGERKGKQKRPQSHSRSNPEDPSDEGESEEGDD